MNVTEMKEIEAEEDILPTNHDPEIIVTIVADTEAEVEVRATIITHLARTIVIIEITALAVIETGIDRITETVLQRRRT